MFNFFAQENSRQGDVFSLSGRDYNHIKNVLRMKNGEKFILCDGAGTDYLLLQTLPAETPVTCLGHYTDLWLRVETAKSLVGFCHSDCLVRGESR